MYLVLSAVSLTLAAAVGFAPLRSLIKQLPAKLKFVWLHGGLALSGVVFIIIHALTQPSDQQPWLGFLITLITALGGIGLFVLRRLKAPIPAGIALLHPLAGAVGLVLLYQELFK